MSSPSVASLQRAFYSVALLIIAVVILYYAQIVFVPVALAILLAFILSPLVVLLERYGFWRWLGIVLVALFAFAILGLIFWIASVEVGTLVREFPAHEKDLDRKLAGIEHVLKQMQQLSEIGAANRTVPPQQTQNTQATPAPVVVEQRGSSYVSWIPAVAGPLVEILARALLVIVLTIFMMAQRETLRDRLLRLVGLGNLTSTSKALDDAAERVSKYLLNQLGTNTFVGIGVTLGVYFIGIPNALLWGFLTIALRFIPYVGVWLAALLPFVVGAAFFPGWAHALAVLGVYLFLELITANVIEPLLFGHSTGVSPIALLVAAVFWAWLWGAVGLLMSTPLTVCLVVLGKHVPYLEFFDTLLGAAPTLDAATRLYHNLVVRDQEGATALVQQQLATSPADQVYDQVFLPALALTKSALEQRELSTDETRAIGRQLADLLALMPAPGPLAGPPSGARRRLIACTSGGQVDEMALRLLRHFLQRGGWDVRIITGRRAVARVLALVREGWSGVACVGQLSPGSAAQLASLCRQLHAQTPQLTILAARWGQQDEPSVRGALQNAGAHTAVASLRELRDQLNTAGQAERPPAPPAATGDGRAPGLPALKDGPTPLRGEAP